MAPVWVRAYQLHELLSALEWLHAHRSFMEDRATINRIAREVAQRHEQVVARRMARG